MTYHVPEDDDFSEFDECPRCGGDGYIMAVDGDPSDWGEDTYCGPEDASILCPECKGKGTIK